MSQISKVIAAVSMTLIASTPAWAQPIVYPAKGQSAAIGAIVMIGSCTPA